MVWKLQVGIFPWNSSIIFSLLHSIPGIPKTLWSKEKNTYLLSQVCQLFQCQAKSILNVAHIDLIWVSLVHAPSTLDTTSMCHNYSYFVLIFFCYSSINHTIYVINYVNKQTSISLYIKHSIVTKKKPYKPLILLHSRYRFNFF